MIEKLISEFQAPGNEHRGASFWAWNGELEVNELRQHIRDMHEMGLGVFLCIPVLVWQQIIFPRSGLNVPKCRRTVYW